MGEDKRRFDATKQIKQKAFLFCTDEKTIEEVTENVMVIDVFVEK